MQISCAFFLVQSDKRVYKGLNYYAFIKESFVIFFRKIRVLFLAALMKLAAVGLKTRNPRSI